MGHTWKQVHELVASTLHHHGPTSTEEESEHWRGCSRADIHDDVARRIADALASELEHHLLIPAIGWDDRLKIVGVICPWVDRGKEGTRPCNWGEMAEDCLWDRWESGSHHPDCPDDETCEASTPPDREAPTCWAEEPEECDGFESEAGHLHPVDDVCGVRESIAIGYEDAWVWSAKAEGYEVQGPIPVTISWEDHWAELTPVEYKAEP